MVTANKPNYRRIALKIGSNVLTRPDGTLDITTMSTRWHSYAAPE